MVKELNLSNDKLYYVYTGQRELNGCCKILSNDIKKLLPSVNLVCDDNTTHNESAWKDKVYEALDYILL